MIVQWSKGENWNVADFHRSLVGWLGSCMGRNSAIVVVGTQH